MVFDIPVCRVEKVSSSSINMYSLWIGMFGVFPFWDTNFHLKFKGEKWDFKSKKENSFLQHQKKSTFLSEPEFSSSFQKLKDEQSIVAVFNVLRALQQSP